MISRSAFTRLAGLAAALAIGVHAPSTARAADGAKLFDAKCAQCHGPEGASQEPMIPIIGGFTVKYITESFKNFRAKARSCPEVTIPSGPNKGSRSDMCKVVNDLPPAEQQAIANWLSTRKFVRAKQPFDRAKAERGESVRGRLCRRCHEQGGNSPDNDNGIVAGQWTPYLKSQLDAFRAGKRAIDEKMEARLQKLTLDEQDALLNFYASQQ